MDDRLLELSRGVAARRRVCHACKGTLKSSYQNEGCFNCTNPPMGLEGTINS